MSVRVKAQPRRTPAIVLGSPSTGIAPAALSRGNADRRISRSEKIVSGIAIGVLLAGLAGGTHRVSAARGFRSEPHVTHTEYDAGRREQ